MVFGICAGIEMFQKRSHIVVQVFCLYAVTKTVGVRKEKSTVQSIFGRLHLNKTRICIQTAGSAFGLCSYRVRGDDGSCVEHLTVESYLPTDILIIVDIP